MTLAGKRREMTQMRDAMSYVGSGAVLSQTSYGFPAMLSQEGGAYAALALPTGPSLAPAPGPVAGSSGKGKGYVGLPNPPPHHHHPRPVRTGRAQSGWLKDARFVVVGIVRTREPGGASRAKGSRQVGGSNRPASGATPASQVRRGGCGGVGAVGRPSVHDS